MKTLAIIVAFGLAGPAAADDLTDFLGRYGCTFGAQSRAAALAAGFTEAQIDEIMEIFVDTLDAFAAEAGLEVETAA